MASTTTGKSGFSVNLNEEDDPPDKKGDIFWDDSMFSDFGDEEPEDTDCDELKPLSPLKMLRRASSVESNCEEVEPDFCDVKEFLNPTPILNSEINQPQEMKPILFVSKAFADSPYVSDDDDLPETKSVLLTPIPDLEYAQDPLAVKPESMLSNNYCYEYEIKRKISVSAMNTPDSEDEDEDVHDLKVNVSDINMNWNDLSEDFFKRCDSPESKSDLSVFKLDSLITDWEDSETQATKPDLSLLNMNWNDFSDEFYSYGISECKADGSVLKFNATSSDPEDEDEEADGIKPDESELNMHWNDISNDFYKRYDTLETEHVLPNTSSVDDDYTPTAKRRKKVLWSSKNMNSNAVGDNADALETKPDISKIVIDPVLPHHKHDYSIHLYNREKYCAPPRTSTSSPKCVDSFAASTCCELKRWTTEDAAKAILTERSFYKDEAITITLPEKEITIKDIKSIHPSIGAVQFMQSPFPRRCCVTLKDSNRELCSYQLSRLGFGDGHLKVNYKFAEIGPPLDDIDPFTLVLDNIPEDKLQSDIIDMFPTSQQIIIWYSSKIYYIKRYAFIIYSNVKDALNAFDTVNRKFDMLVRFRRFNGSLPLPIESEIKMCQNNIPKDFPIMVDPGPPIPMSEESLLTTETKEELKKIGCESLSNEANDSVKVIDKKEDDDDDDVYEFIDFKQIYKTLVNAREQCKLLRKKLLVDD